MNAATGLSPTRPWAWAASQMPLLRRTAQECGDALSGLSIGICLHLEPKTAVLVETLLGLGVDVTATGSPGTTHADTASALRAAGATIIASPADGLDDHARNVSAVVSARPDLLLDNGADLIVEACQSGVSVLAATEETTSGALRLRSGAVEVLTPVIVINDSPLKRLVENERGVGQSVVQGFMNATNLMLPGLPAAVVGYGPCGRGVADTLASLGASVTVVEPDPYRALEAAMDGRRVAELEPALADARAVFLASGVAGAVPPEALGWLPDGCVLAGVSHFPDDVDLTHLRARSSERQTFTTRFAELETLRVDGRRLTVVNELHMVNLSAAAGNPIEAMDLGLSLQLRSLAWLAAGKADWIGPAAPPDEIDRAVARGMVDLLSGRHRR